MFGCLVYITNIPKKHGLKKTKLPASTKLAHFLGTYDLYFVAKKCHFKAFFFLEDTFI